MYKDEIKKLRIKKNTIIFVVLFSVIALVLFYFLAHKFKLVDANILDGVYFFLVIVYFVLIVTFKNRFNYYVYKYEYLLMLEEDLPPIKTKKEILSDSWQQLFLKDGFKKYVNTTKYAIYYQIPDKESPFYNFGKTMLFIVVNKDKDLDLYGTTIQNKIKEIYTKIEKDYPRIKKEVVIHFKEYERFDDESKKELQKVLNFKQDTFTLINITVGYFKDKKQVYYLRPEIRYPNKFYYLACDLIKRYI